MATFIITIKTRYIGDSKTIKARSLNSAKAQATAAFNALSSSIGQITIANENGVKLSHKLIENSRGKWEDVIAVEAVEAVKAVKAVKAVEAPKKAKRRACVPVQIIESKDNEVVELGTLTQDEQVKPNANLRDYQIKTLSNAIVSDGGSKGFVGRAVIVEPQQKPKLVSKYDTEIHDNREFVELFGASFEIYGYIVPPVHARIQHGSAINKIHVLATKESFKQFKAMWLAGIKPNQFCFVECDCGTVVYVTIDEATRLGQPVIRNIKQTESFACQGKMNTRLYYEGTSAETLYPILKSENGAKVEISRVMTAKVFAENGELVVSNCSDVVAMPDHYMVSDDAGQAMRDYFNKGWFMPFEIGFVQTSCGMAAIVTDEEAEKLGESFLKVKLQD